MNLFPHFLLCSLSICGVHSVDPVLVAQLTNEAVKLSAPFLETAMTRLHSDTFGSGRAARSTDVILFNKSDKDFKLKKNSCSSGGWSKNMFPEHLLPKHSSTVYGNESGGFMTGVQCVVKYVSADGSYFYIEVDNPYFGRNKIFQWHSDSLFLIGTKSKGMNNQVRWIIQDS